MKTIWILESPHTGDNTQLMALAENLGWPYRVKKLGYLRGQTLARLTLGSTLLGLTDETKMQITPPFPDVVLGAGRANEAAALWIKSRNPLTKLVYIGTPWAKLEKFDLVITTPQYGLPQRANILHNQLPVHKMTPQNLADAAKLWQSRFSHLPKPWTAILVGGESGPYTFRKVAALRLSKICNDLQGSVLITTSARTPNIVAETLQSEIRIQHYFHRWQHGQSENPFFAYLALADQFVVTADSISMLSEACATGKPVTLFDTEQGRTSMQTPITFLGRNLSTTAFRFAMLLGPANWSRDLRKVHQQLVQSGRATWIGDKANAPREALQNDLERATSRIKALFEL